MNVSDCLYRLFRPVVDYATRCHYASVTVRGVEQLPKEGGYILAPCHQNAMMEPLLVLVMIPKPVYFICRGDIFANSLANKFLTFLKMFPIFRRRDGLKSLERNKVTFDESQRVLLDGYPLCMMAEGQHNDRHQLLPLVKGMFRIAGTTQAQMGDQPLYIVPLGIDLDDYERPFSHAVLNVGEPIDVRQFMEDFLNDEPKALNAMRETLTQGLKASTWKELEADGKFDKNKKLDFVTDETLRKGSLYVRRLPIGLTHWNKVRIWLTKQSYNV